MKLTTIATICAALLAGCHAHDGVGREPDEYTGCGNDENWRAFSDQEPTATVADTTAPKVTAPLQSAVLAGGAPPAFEWQPDENEVGMPDGDVVHAGPSCNDCCPTYSRGSLAPLHLPPISGTAYDLQLSVGGEAVWRVITTLQQWGPPPALWARLAGKTVELKIYRMELLRNDVKAGPFVATTPLTFSVGS